MGRLTGLGLLPIVMTEPPAIDLLRLLYEDGDKTKLFSPLVDNPSGGAKIGRYLGKNSSKDISEWADMIFLLAKKKVKPAY